MPTSAVLKNDFNDNHQNEPKKDRRVISKNVFFEVAEISNESYLQLHIATQYKAAKKNTETTNFQDWFKEIVNLATNWQSSIRA